MVVDVRDARGRRFGNPLGFALHFAEPVTGPITLGFGAHLGLGLFLPAEARDSGTARLSRPMPG